MLADKLGKFEAAELADTAEADVEAWTPVIGSTGLLGGEDCSQGRYCKKNEKKHLPDSEERNWFQRK